MLVFYGLELKVQTKSECAGTGICAVVDARSVFAGEKFGVEAGVVGDCEHVLNLAVDVEVGGSDFADKVLGQGVCLLYTSDAADD